MSNFLVFGTGGHAKVVLESIRAAIPKARIALLDDNPAKWGGTLLETPIVGGREHAVAARGIPLVPAVGDNAARYRMIEWATEERLPLASVIHPSAIVSPSAVIGAGSFIGAGAIINAGARIGRGVIINTGASIDHDCILGDGVHIGPGARLCGSVTVGARTLAGVGSVVIPGIIIGEDCIIGAGSAVIRPVWAGTCVVGVPAVLGNGRAVGRATERAA